MGRGLDCSQYQILIDLRNGLKNPNMNLVMIGPIGWEEFDDRQIDRQTDDRQTDDRQTTDRRQTDRQIESLCVL